MMNGRLHVKVFNKKKMTSSSSKNVALDIFHMIEELQSYLFRIPEMILSLLITIIKLSRPQLCFLGFSEWN